MDMYLELNKKEMDNAITSFVKIKYNKVLAYSKTCNIFIDINDIDDSYCKNIQAVSVRKEDIVIHYEVEGSYRTNTFSHNDLEECVNEFFLKEKNLKIIGGINFYFKFEDKETIRNMESGSNCGLRQYYGELMVGFQVRNKEIKIKIK